VEASVVSVVVRRGTIGPPPATPRAEEEDNMSIVVWLLIGLVAGLIARVLVPGKDRLGIGGTLVLGLVGSLVGGFLGDLIQPGDQDFSPAGIIGSIVGAIIALLAYRAMSGRRSRIA
jgi:uncharacterized membrane protein YeaQ/YmgE (transglycosylase-associated protein family)